MKIEIIINNLVILPELEAYIMPLANENFSQLESNILAEGLRDSIIVWECKETDMAHLLSPYAINKEEFNANNPAYVLVDGHNRFRISQKHSLISLIKVTIKQFCSLQEVKSYMIDLQIGRRNATKEQQSYLRGLQKNLYGQKHGGDRASGQNDHLKTITQIAEQHQVSEKTIQRDGKFAEGIGIIRKYHEGLANDILAGRAKKVPKEVIEMLPKIAEVLQFNGTEFLNQASIMALYEAYKAKEQARHNKLLRKNNNKALAPKTPKTDSNPQRFVFYIKSHLVDIWCTKKSYDLIDDYIKELHELLSQGSGKLPHEHN